MVPLFGRNPNKLNLIFTLYYTYQRHHLRLELWNLYNLQLPHLQRFADGVARKGAPSYNCFDFVNGTIPRICRAVLNESVVYSHHASLHGVKFQREVLPNGLIINLEGQWEDRGHDCITLYE